MSSRKRLFEEKEEEICTGNQAQSKDENKATAAGAAVPKGEVTEDVGPKNENEAKRIKYWAPTTELSIEFLNTIGIRSDAKDVLKKLQKKKVDSVGSLLGSSREQLERIVKLSMGSVNAIMLFIEEQKGKNDEQTCNKKREEF